MKSIEEMKSSPRLLVVKEGFDGLMGYLHHPRYRLSCCGHYCLVGRRLGAR